MLLSVTFAEMGVLTWFVLEQRTYNLSAVYESVFITILSYVHIHVYKARLNDTGIQCFGIGIMMATADIVRCFIKCWGFVLFILEA